MKKILLLLLMFPCITFAQKQLCNPQNVMRVENIIKQDSIKLVLFNCITEECEKMPFNMCVDQQSCPVFIDNEGFIFLIKLSDGYLTVIDWDYD